MSKYKVCITDVRHESYEIERRILAEIDAELVPCNCSSAEEIVRNCSDADGLLLDLAPCTAEAINGLQNCKVINRYGAGYDNVDVEAATAKGIQVTYVPDYCMEDVSDHALALMLSCLRHVAYKDRSIRSGKWNIQAQGFRIAGKTLGVLGFGRIARSLVKKCSGFGLAHILAYDPYVSAEVMSEFGVEKASMDDVLAQADFLSLHMAVTPETHGIINAQALGKMKPTAILVNVTRGQLVDDESLLDALRNGKILAAGLDTHNKEPLSPESPFLALDNVVLTDHTAYNTAEGTVELKTKSARNIVDVLSGKKPVYTVNQL